MGEGGGVKFECLCERGDMLVGRRVGGEGINGMVGVGVGRAVCGVGRAVGGMRVVREGREGLATAWCACDLFLPPCLPPHPHHRRHHHGVMGQSGGQGGMRQAGGHGGMRQAGGHGGMKQAGGHGGRGQAGGQGV